MDRQSSKKSERKEKEWSVPWGNQGYKMKMGDRTRRWAAAWWGILALVPVSASLTNLPATRSRSSLFSAIVLPLLMLGLTANSNFLAYSLPTLQGAWQEAPTSSPPLPFQARVRLGELQMVLSRFITEEPRKQSETRNASSSSLHIWGWVKNWDQEKGLWFAQGQSCPHTTAQTLSGRPPRRLGLGGDAQPVLRTQGIPTHPAGTPAGRTSRKRRDGKMTLPLTGWQVALIAGAGRGRRGPALGLLPGSLKNRKWVARKPPLS